MAKFRYGVFYCYERKIFIVRIDHKAYLILSLKYNIKLFDSFESKIAEKISNIAAEERVISNSVSYRFLVFNHDSSNSNFWNQVRASIQLLRYRGQLRTLLLIAKPFSKYEDFYELSRFRLVLVLARNFRLLNRNVLTKLSMEYFDYKTYLSNNLYPPTQLGNKFTINKFQSLNSFIFDKNRFKPHKVSFFKKNHSNLNFIDSFILWDSYLFMRFIREFNLEEKVSVFLQKNHELVLKDLTNLRMVNVENLKMFDSSLDDIYAEKGKSYSIPISNAEIWHQRFVVFKNTLLNLDATASPGLDFVAGIWQFVWKVNNRESKYEIVAPVGDAIHLDEAIYLIGRVDENWYHFLLDTAPRILFFDLIPESVPVLIRRDIPESSKYLLGLITSRKVVEVDSDDFVRVDKLHVLPGRSTVFDSDPPKELKQVQFSPIILNLFRKKILERLMLDSKVAPDKKIFFSRRSVIRNVVNWEKNRQVLLSSSVVEVPFDAEFFYNQIEIFYSSSLVVSPGGAVLANIIFMKPKGEVIALTSFRNKGIELWRELSECFDLNYTEITGYPTYWGFNRLRRVHSSFYVSPKKLRRILSREI